MIGYLVGTRQGRDGMKKSVDAFNALRSSPEVHQMVRAGAGIAGNAVRQVLGGGAGAALTTAVDALARKATEAMSGGADADARKAA